MYPTYYYNTLYLFHENKWFNVVINENPITYLGIRGIADYW